MSSSLLKWHRHCFNQRVSEKLRPGFPVLGMYDTWLIDILQVLVSLNWSVLLFPEWSNTSDYAPTDETFDTVPLHSAELGAAIKQIPLPAAFKLTPEQAFVAKSAGTKLSLLPVYGKEESMLFHALLLAAPSGPTAIDFDSMAIEWCKHVDCNAIFPKLPVYLRKHYNDWNRNQKVRKAVGGAAAQVAQLKALNRHTAPAPLPAPAPAPTVAPFTAAPAIAAPVRAASVHATPVSSTPVLAAPVRAAPVLATPALVAPVSSIAARVRAAPILAALAAPVSSTPVFAARGIPMAIGAPLVFHARMASAASAMRAASCAQEAPPEARRRRPPEVLFA
ncbi:hypothetical protein T492DRAFT_881800 [Pavlovales sp. CCMP2436]|nr:hypothetical protein T492DRAFT_881800 [Pavlovales sp. CCMP2436]